MPKTHVNAQGTPRTTTARRRPTAVPAPTAPTAQLSEAEAEDRREHVLDPARVITFDPPESGPKSTLAVRLNGADIDRLRHAAEHAGVGVTQLARLWLTERLALEEQLGTADDSTVRPAFLDDIAELSAVAARLQVAAAHLALDNLSPNTAKSRR
jgi:hypothetical protein